MQIGLSNGWLSLGSFGVVNSIIYFFAIFNYIFLRKDFSYIKYSIMT